MPLSDYPRWFSIVLLPAALSVLATPALPIELSREDAFIQTAQLDGQAHAIGRSLFEREGKAILPFLRQKASSPVWRQRNLARALILRIEEPEKVALWLHAMAARHAEVELGEEATVRVTLPPYEGPKPAQPGTEPEPTTVVIDRNAVPVILDRLRDTAGGRISENEVLWRRSLRVLEHLAAPEAAPGLLHRYGVYSRHGASIVDALAAIGEPAAPVLRDAVRDCPTEWPDGYTEAARQTRERNWPAMMRATGAALALGRIGDTESAPLLMSGLKEATHSKQTEGYCAALGEMRAPEAVPLVFAELGRIARPDGKRRYNTSRERRYTPVREAMLSFADAALEFLKQRAHGDGPLTTRAIASGLLFELEHPEAAASFYRTVAPLFGRTNFWERYRLDATPEAIPAPLLIERAYVYFSSEDLLRLARLKGNSLAFEVLADGLLRHKFSDEYGPQLALALAGMGDKRALEAYRELLEPEPTRYIDSVVVATLLLGSRDAVPMLEEVVRRADDPDAAHAAQYRAAAELAEAVLPAMGGDRQRLAELLEAEAPTVREVAARCLARRGDARGLRILLDAAVAAREHMHRQLRDDILALGSRAVGPLRKHKDSATDWHPRVLCEALLIRILEPELVAVFVEAAAFRPRGFMNRGGPSVGDYQAAGRHVADAVGEAGIPLLEAALAFDADPLYPGIAVCALACLKQERSVPVIAESFARVRGARGGSLVALALQEFGEKGIEAAKHIPTPDPDKERFGVRARRHRGATEALALAEDVKGVDNIVSGLRVPRPEDTGSDYWAWHRSMEAYLRLASEYHDERLVSAVLGLLRQQEPTLWAEAIDVLAAYDDERIVPLCVKLLGVTGGDHEARETRAAAVKALVRRLGRDAVPLLVDVLRRSADANERLGAAEGLGSLATKRGRRWTLAPEDRERGARAGWAVPLADPEQSAAGAHAFALARAPLYEALRDPSTAVQVAAAKALVYVAGNFTDESDDWPPVEQLVTWAASGPYPPREVIEYLAGSGDPGAAKALLAAYRAWDRRGASLARALGELRCTEALPDLSQALDTSLATWASWTRSAEMEALANLGGAGLEKVHSVLRGAAALAPRVRAAGVLGKHGHRPAFRDVAALLEQLMAMGPEDARLGQRAATERRTNYRNYGSALAGSLASLDAEAAYPIIVSAMLGAEDEQLRRSLQWQIQQMEKAHPDLHSLSVLDQALMP